jgi:hypothetical protein
MEMFPVLFSNYVSNFGFQVTIYKPPLHMLYRWFFMSATQSQGISIAYRIPRTGQLPGVVSNPVSTGGSLPVVFRKKAKGELLNRFAEKFRMSGIEISPGEIQELAIFDDFLEHHIQPNRVCDVQCMYLWNEWVRAFRSQTHGFPKLILEKEFRSVIMDRFGIAVVTEDKRGAVYPGLKFVP